LVGIAEAQLPPLPYINGLSSCVSGNNSEVVSICKAACDCACNYSGQQSIEKSACNNLCVNFIVGVRPICALVPAVTNRGTNPFNPGCVDPSIIQDLCKRGCSCCGNAGGGGGTPTEIEKCVKNCSQSLLVTLLNKGCLAAKDLQPTGEGATGIKLGGGPL